jgi:thioredoxin 1
LLSILVLLLSTLALLAACASPSKASPTATSLQWGEATSNGHPTLAEFGRGTCIPCKEMKPILEDIARQYDGRLNVMIISVDEYAALTREFRITAIPTQIFLDEDGEEVSRHIGFLPKKDIVAALSRMGIE